MCSAASGIRHCGISVLGFFLVCFVTNTPILAQEPKSKDTPLNLQKTTSTGEHLEEYRLLLPANKQRAISEKLPIFIFIPGLLGSSIQIVYDSGVRVTAWGEHLEGFFSSGKDLVYDPDEKVETKILRNILDIGILKIDVYDGSLGSIESVSGYRVGDVSSFSYDWRQDIRKSATDLENWLRSSKISSNLYKRPLIFISHSMGGLVYRYWYGKYYQRNSGTYSFNGISRSIFLGVPHLGTPEALLALTLGHSLFFPYGSVLARAEQATLNLALNESGASFESIYQLLPQYSTSIARVQYGDGQTDFTDLDIFDPSIWKRFQWPKTKPINMKDEAYYEKLPSFLRDALIFHVELSHFSPIPDSYYLYSRDQITPIGLIGHLEK